MTSPAAEPPTPAAARLAQTGRNRRRAAGVLGAAVILTSLGLLVNAFRGEGSAINTYLFMECELSHGTAAMLERSAVGLVLACAVAAARFRRGWPYVVPAAYLLTEALARRYVQGQPFSEWALFTDAARYVAPLGALVLLAGGARPWATSTVGGMLRLSLAAVFAAHGAEALSAHPGFIDYILSSGQNLVGVHLTEHAARQVLQLIGFTDCAVAAALLLWPASAVLAWTAAWAAITAFSRITANGWGAYPDVLLRATYILAPIALVALRVRDREPHGGTDAPLRDDTTLS